MGFLGWYGIVGLGFVTSDSINQLISITAVEVCDATKVDLKNNAG